MDMGAGEYTLFEADGQMVGGTKAAELGGSVLVPQFDTPVGRMAVIADPQGAVFSIIQQAPQPA